MVGAEHCWAVRMVAGSQDAATAALPESPRGNVNAASAAEILRIRKERQREDRYVATHLLFARHAPNRL